MYIVGIDISKFKHDCFIATETGQVVKDSFSFKNDCNGFNDFLNVLKSLDNTQEIRIGLEATGHYGSNLKIFLHDNNYSFMEINPVFSERFRQETTLRKTKTDKIDAKLIASYILTHEYKTYSLKSYHILSLKSLTRLRFRLIQARTKHKVRLQNIMDLTFPEYFSMFTDPFGSVSTYLLNNYPSAEKLTKANFEALYSEISRISRSRFTKSKFEKLISLAKNTIGKSNDVYELEIISTMKMITIINEEINTIENKIESIMNQYQFKTQTIPGIGIISAATIVSEFGDFSFFNSPGQMLSFAGLEPAVYQSGTQKFTGKMVKRGSPYLRYILMNVSTYIIKYDLTFYNYYHKKRDSGKAHRVALTHVAKKLIRVIYHLEKTNSVYNSSLLK